MAKLKNVKSKKNSRLVFWVQLLIAVILIATMSAGLLQLGGNGQVSSAAPDFPPWVAGLKIENYVIGEDAKKQMSKSLPNETSSLRDAWMAYYEERAVVWVGQATSENEANRLLNVIRTNIQNAISAESDFKLQTSNKKGLSVYIIRFKERDSEYFYQKGDKVFWVSLPIGKEGPFINEVLDKLN